MILQFKAPYSLSEITSNIRDGMATAIATAMGKKALAKSVTLNFTEVDIRRSQQRGVLVDVGLRDYQGSTEVLLSSLKASNINTEMLALGLRPVQVLVLNSESPPVTSSYANKTSGVPEAGASSDSKMIVIAASCVGALSVIAGFFYWRLSRSSKSKLTNVS